MFKLSKALQYEQLVPGNPASILIGFLDMKMSVVLQHTIKIIQKISILISLRHRNSFLKQLCECLGDMQMLL